MTSTPDESWLSTRLRAFYSNIGYDETNGGLRDFTTTKRIVLVGGLAVGVGVLSGFVALVLLRLIGVFTNLFFFGRWGTNIPSPAESNLGVVIILVPIVGATIVGLMARYGSDKIRGHGIPEAIEAILMNGSRVQPRLAILKPLSSAIAIGSGGPFGAEGPIIMTGGAVGSIIAQFIHLSSAERKTLLVAGAAGGMAAVFATPLAAVLLAVELLLFEWKPRSLIPVALSSAAAYATRHYLLGAGPLFPMPPQEEFIGVAGLAGCIVVGLSAGLLSVALTQAVYMSEDGFEKLPIHWMWWPTLGGVVIGIGGFIFPDALGVGYGSIGEMLSGTASTHLLVGMLLVKSVIWSVSLGSGTSGGVVAPMLLVGGALGGLEAGFLPTEGAGFWVLMAMGATFAGTFRSPLTGIVFAFELTQNVHALAPLMVTVMVAYGFTVLAMRRSILTEKISRRGYHLASEYSLDPLEIVLCREVMRTNVTAIPAETKLDDLRPSLGNVRPHSEQRLYPVLDISGRLSGVVSRTKLMEAFTADGKRTIQDLVELPVIVAYPDEPLRVVVNRMAVTGRTRLPVVSRVDAGELQGMVGLHDLLKARTKTMDEERHRERVLRTRMLLPRRRRPAMSA